MIDVESAKKIFAKNLVRIMKSYGGDGRGIKAPELESLIKNKASETVSHSYIRRLMRSVEEPDKYPETPNMSFDAAEAIAKGLGVSLEKLISPHMENEEQPNRIDIELLSKAMNEAESVAIDLNIQDRTFIRIATAIQYNGYAEGDEKKADREIMKLIKSF